MLSEGLADSKNFALLDLVNPCIFRQWIKGVSPDMLQFLKCKHGPLSIFNHLKNQLIFFTMTLIFTKTALWRYCNILINGLETSVPEAFKLLKLHSVISISSASVEKSVDLTKDERLG